LKIETLLYMEENKWKSPEVLTGIGTLLLGLAAWAALWETNTILEKLTKVQQTAENIQQAVALLREQITAQKAAAIFQNSPILQAPNPTKEDVEKAIDSLPTAPGIEGNGTAVILPYEKRRDVINKMLQTTDPYKRQLILQDNLEAVPQGKR
jgi:hypothetical protein